MKSSDVTFYQHVDNLVNKKELLWSLSVAHFNPHSMFSYFFLVLLYLDRNSLISDKATRNRIMPVLIPEMCQEPSVLCWILMQMMHFAVDAWARCAACYIRDVTMWPVWQWFPWCADADVDACHDGNSRFGRITCLAASSRYFLGVRENLMLLHGALLVLLYI